MRQQKPVIYQQIEGLRKTVEGSYRFTNKKKDTVGFELAAYDPKHQLVIDPVLVYSTYLGGSSTGTEYAAAVKVDVSGNAYVAGNAQLPNFPQVNTGPTFEPDPVAAGLSGQVGFIAKFDSSGTLLYTAFIGGSGVDEISDIDEDGSNIHIIGNTTSTDFPITEDALSGGTTLIRPPRSICGDDHPGRNSFGLRYIAGWWLRSWLDMGARTGCSLGDQSPLRGRVYKRSRFPCNYRCVPDNQWWDI